MEDKLSLTGDILLNDVAQKEVRDYKKIEIPVVTFGNHSMKRSSSPGVFGFLVDLTIYPTSNNLYICDGGNDRVQVFSESFEFIFIFSDKIGGLVDICISKPM